VSAEQGAWDDVREVKCENGTGNYLDALTHELYTVYNCPVLSGVHRDPSIELAARLLKPRHYVSRKPALFGVAPFNQSGEIRSARADSR
jgi:hypothetical protein